MCGIVGILNFNRQPVTHEQLKSMTDVIAHRGPDGEGQWVDQKGYVGLGHRRLAIIDLTTAGQQPMQSNDGRYTITYNGEIYNFRALRSELQSLGYQFHSHTDSEVVLNAFMHWKEKCLLKFNGMFAFAIWDNRERRFFLARDRYGIKPLYYYLNDNALVFASEVKAIQSFEDYRAKLEPEALLEYLTFQNFFTDKTLYQGIKMLMPGHFAYVGEDDFGRMRIEQYWDYNFCGSLTISEEEAIEEVDRLFNQAVERQLISDVPVNCYLSGGIDSGAITVLASQKLEALKTFTIGFDLSSSSGLELSFDERDKAEHISYLAGTEHYEMVLKAGDMERCMDKYVWHLEEPRVGQSYPNYYAAKLASKFGKVVLSGCGGDEFFGGYPWRYFYADDGVKFSDYIDQYYLKWQRLVSNSQLRVLLEPIWDDVKHIQTKDVFTDVFDAIKKDVYTPRNCLNASFYLEAKTFLHGLLVVEDKLSMAHSLETRVPFLDNDLVDFAMRLPAKYKVSKQTSIPRESDLASKKVAGNQGKILLRKVLGKYLDDDIINLKKKGFSSPDASWFRGESIDYVEHQFKHLPTFLNKAIAREIFDEHITAANNNRLVIWSLLYLKKFGECYLP